MLRPLRCYRLLDGHRGSPPVDLAAVEHLLMRLSATGDDLHEVAELDLNPCSPARMESWFSTRG
jgi:hypothetical protein